MKRALDLLYCHLIGAGPELHWDPHVRVHILQRPPPQVRGDPNGMTDRIIKLGSFEDQLTSFILIRSDCFSHSVTNPPACCSTTAVNNQSVTVLTLNNNQSTPGK